MRYRAELLPNGLLRVWDYSCKWGLLYHKDENGKWASHCGLSSLPANKHLLEKINENV
jgi:hypothetical protein